MPQDQELERTCGLYGNCRYPCTHARYFTPTNLPCSQGDQCEVEIAIGEPSIILTHFWASTVESKVARGLPWNCGCELCQNGNWMDCYRKSGPDKELRALIAGDGYTTAWQEHQQYIAQQAQRIANTAEAKAP